MHLAEDIRRPAPFSFSRSRARRLVAVGLIALTLQLGSSGCFGRFALTRKVYAVNQSVNDKWLRSILTFVLVVVPVYGISAFADWALFNTIEFWGGKNPVDGQSSDPAPPPIAPPSLTKRIGDTKLELSEDGRVLRVEFVTSRADLPRVLVLEMFGDNAVLRTEEGNLISSLRTAADGSSEVLAANGAVLDRKRAADREQLGAALEVGGEALLSELEMQNNRRLALTTDRQGSQR